jgi:L-lactate utilization protein LutC
MSREYILHKARTALGRSVGQAPAPAPPVLLRSSRLDPDAGISSFFQAIERLAGKTYLAASPEDACSYVCALVAGRRAVASNALFLRECGIASLPSVETGFTAEQPLREACAAAEFGITSADYALADTGTLVMLASPEDARLVSLLPPVHVAVLPRNRLLSGLDELLELLPRPAEQTSSMVLITGPSRTADIEQILVRGVHGPGSIHVVLV